MRRRREIFQGESLYKYERMTKCSENLDIFAISVLSYQGKGNERAQ